ncbi:integrase core domain-containing protein [Paraburkholderia sp. BR14263]|uniref:Integrase core domain-containing protein n=1 Tax=Paraburkholderia ferrariae TaxID=386056 RepID=A0ABU9S3A2_9BURK
MAASYAFVAEPQTNGVAERFNRNMKEQAIHGRIFKNVDEVRDAVVDFKRPLQPRVAAGKTGVHVTPRTPSGMDV